MNPVRLNLIENETKKPALQRSHLTASALPELTDQNSAITKRPNQFRLENGTIAIVGVMRWDPQFFFFPDGQSDIVGVSLRSN